MHNQMVSTTSPLNPQARAIVEVVLEAIDIPHAATVAHAEVRQTILANRLRHVVGCLRGILERADTMYPGDPGASLAMMSEQVARHPATGYVTVEQAQQRLRDRMDWMRAVGQVES